jgi:hypothetical protein
MTSLVTADEKGRLPIRGTKKGRQYLVRQSGDGWYICPVEQEFEPIPRNRKEWDPPKGKRSLSEILGEMGDLGLRIEPSKESKKPVPPCQF